jgi:hypothetical protein
MIPVWARRSVRKNGFVSGRAAYDPLFSLSEGAQAQRWDTVPEAAEKPCAEIASTERHNSRGPHLRHDRPSRLAHSAVYTRSMSNKKNKGWKSIGQIINEWRAKTKRWRQMHGISEETGADLDLVFRAMRSKRTQRGEAKHLRKRRRA